MPCMASLAGKKSLRRLIKPDPNIHNVWIACHMSLADKAEAQVNANLHRTGRLRQAMLSKFFYFQLSRLRYSSPDIGEQTYGK